MSSGTVAAPPVSGTGAATRGPVAGLALLGVMAGAQGADPNVASTALVGAGRGLGMSGDLLALAASISTLVLSATVISTGLLADRLGRRGVLMAALVLAAVGDLLVAGAPASPLYLLGRALAGIGFGAVFGAAFAYIRAITPPDRIAGAMGVFGAVSGGTALVLTFLGGALASVHWRLAFVVLPVVALLCVPAVRALLPAQEPRPDGPTDYPGQVLLALGVVGVLYGFSHAASGLTSPATLGPLLGGFALLAAFAWRERASGAGEDRRFFPVELFRRPVFLAAVCAGFVYNFGTAVGFLQLTNLWQYVTGLSTLSVSLWQLPFLVSGIAAAVVVGRAMTRGLAAAAVVGIGTLTSAVGFVLLAVLHSSTSLWGFLPGSILLGGGVIIASLPYGTLIISQADARYFGPVTSARTTIGQFYYAAGLALSTVLIDRLTTGGVVRRLTEAGVPPTQTGQGLDAVTAFAAAGTQPDTALGQPALGAATGSYASGFVVTMLVCAVLALVVGGAGWLLLRRSAQAPPASR
ncbi:MFS transporter [Nakamurella flava]|uniref:MFS transporter n=1 Tax=Nakamurella flava TaxID=2576308 RepID=A0A4V6CTT2_9ACTN|nr:MFS transporter [Nakamurella flava]TKV60365.1 MFS transporter [Nakamurella flava]